LIIAWRARPIRYAGLLADPGGLGRRRGGGLDFIPRRLGLGRVRAAHLGFSDRLGVRPAGARLLAAIAAAPGAGARPRAALRPPPPAAEQSRAVPPPRRRRPQSPNPC